MTLDQVPTGSAFTIVSIPDVAVRVQALRVGFGEGSRATLQTAVPGGPVILSLGAQEIALGRALARGIKVRPEAAGTCR